MSCHHTQRVLAALEADGLGSLEATLAEHVTGCMACSAALTGRQLADLGVIDAPAPPWEGPSADERAPVPSVDDAAVLAALGLGDMPPAILPPELAFLEALVRLPDDAPYMPQPPPGGLVDDPAWIDPLRAGRSKPVDLPVPGGPAPIADRPSALSRPMAMIPPEEMIDPPAAVPLAPVAVKTTRRNWGAWLAGGGALAAAAVAFLVVYPMVLDRQKTVGDGPDIVASESPAKVAVGGPTEAEKAAAQQAAIEKAVAERLAAEKAARAADAAAVVAGDAGPGEDGADDGEDGARVAAAKPSRRARSRRTAAAKPASPKPAASKPAARRPSAKKESTSEVDDLLGALDGSGGGSKSRAAAPAAASPAAAGDPLLPEKLTRRQILTVVKRNARSITTCKEGTDASGTVPVELIIERSGRVSAATVKSGPVKGTPVGSCIERKVRAFRFPQFSGDPMRIVMPFAL